MTSSLLQLLAQLLLLMLAASIRSGECQGGGGATISLGFILTAASNPSSLSSQPQGTFTFGFAPQADSKFNLGIWYARDASQFLVWTAGRNVLASPGAIMELTQDGDLVLYASSSKNSVLWSSGTSKRGVVRGQLLDSGNLLLDNATAAPLWSSFQNPTDTLLPGQDLVAPPAGGANLTTAPRSPLTSRYTLAMESSGNLTLLWNNDLPYWGSATSGRGGSAVPTVARFDSNGVLNLLLNSSSSNADNVTQFFGSDYGQGPLRRLTLDSDGNLRIYSLAGTGGWIVQWQAVGNQCQVYGFCGAFGICTYSSSSSSASSSSGSPVCICPPGLALNDPKEATKGCSGTGNITQCGASNSRLVQNNNTAWLVYRSEQSSRFSVNNNQEGCKSSCLNDVACVACLVPNDGSGNCIQFRSTFVSGYSFAFLQSTAFLKVCNSAANAPPMAAEQPPSQGPCSAKSATTIGISVAATLAGIILAEALLGWIYCSRRRGRFMGAAPPATARYAVLDYASGAPVRFSYKELQNATKNFSNKIGEGGFGAVYKGFLPMNNTNKFGAAIAVKKLEGVFQGDKEFRTEVATIGSTHHMNLMHLVGFCSEGSSTRLLVYEFMPNGSLDKFLFFDHHRNEQEQQHSMNSMAAAASVESVEEDEESVSLPLDWKTRFNIGVGTAKGIAYLHEECRECIVHCDLKPENILLDDAFRPKVSDFGLARLINEGQTRSLTTVRGTRGYMAPEWLANMPITAKSDVFSYGMILLELIAGRRNFDSSSAIAPEKRKFPSWAFREMEGGRISNIVDQRLISGGGGGGDVNLVQLERMVRVAFWCIQDNAQHRPSTSRVVQMLEGNLAVPQPPMPKFLDGSSSSSSATTSATTTNLSSSSSSQMP